MTMKTQSNPPPVDIISDIYWLNDNLQFDRSQNKDKINGDDNDDTTTTEFDNDNNKDKDMLMIIAAEHVDYKNAGGLNANISKIKLTCNDDSVISCVLKHISGEQSKNLGLSRESLFYELFAKKLADLGLNMATIYYTYGDMSTGEKFIILQDLSECIQCGYAYGPGSPLNWNKDLEMILQPALVHTSITDLRHIITVNVYEEAARIHGYYWKDSTLLQYEWLRGTIWLKGEMKESWIIAQKTGTDYFDRLKKKIESKETTFEWNHLLLRCLESSFSKISWDDYRNSIVNNERSWTLVHGDFHPANMMWNPLSNKVYFLDWEMVGVGNGPQDIAQYMISHADPIFRKEHELEFLKGYYDNLISFGKLDSTTYSFERCTQEYISGGIERWVWMLPLLSARCPDPMVKYFHDQVFAFLIDHHITPETIGMPRV